MSWNSLFENAGIRLGKENEDTQLSNNRSDFQRDFDRIVFSPAFRRLQNKTQVLPLPKSDFVRNRLTHSLETASVGRSLGIMVGHEIIPKYNLPLSPADFGAIVSAACLTHDIGNPPFGHAGEDAISDYFKSEKGVEKINSFTEKQIADLQHFEGNAAGFRILCNTSSQQSSFEGGLRLTYATLATFTKYPKESLPNLKINGRASQKKYGFFQSEKEPFERIANRLNLRSHSNADDLIYNRFPLSYLVEAADDICYSIIDFEDGFNLGYIPFLEIESDYLAVLGPEWDKTKAKYHQIYNETDKISFLRSIVINHLIQKASSLFITKEKEIISGMFDYSLIDYLDPETCQALDQIKRKSIDKIYQSETVLKLEVAGYKVLPNLLDHFVSAILNPKQYSLVYKLIPNEYLNQGKPLEDNYTNVLNMAMYISSMTDRHAVELYKNLNGISLAAY